MSNPNYIKGRRKEYAIVHRMKETCEIAQRTAGSHSPIDVFAIDKKNKTIHLIQGKPKNYSDKKIMKDWGWLNDTFKVKFWVE